MIVLIEEDLNTLGNAIRSMESLVRPGDDDDVQYIGTTRHNDAREHSTVVTDGSSSAGGTTRHTNHTVNLATSSDSSRSRGRSRTTVSRDRSPAPRRLSSGDERPGYYSSASTSHYSDTPDARLGIDTRRLAVARRRNGAQPSPHNSTRKSSSSSAHSVINISSSTNDSGVLANDRSSVNMSDPEAVSREIDNARTAGCPKKTHPGS